MRFSSWISGQKYVVIDEEEQIIFQSFQVDMQDFNDKDYVQELFNIPIQSGNRDLYELVYSLELNQIDHE